MSSDDHEWDAAYGSLSNLDQKAARIMDPTLKADYWDPQWGGDWVVVVEGHRDSSLARLSQQATR